jgi:hypothetical protein
VSTELLRLDDTIAVFKARAEYGDDVWIYGEGHGSETPQGFPPGYIEKAETIAIGRALAALGYGTAAAFEEDSGSKIADAPVAHKQPSRPVAPRPLPGTEKVATHRIDQRTGATEDAAPVMAQPGQVQAIMSLWQRLNRDPVKLAPFLFEQFAQNHPAALTQEEAGKVIGELDKELRVEQRAMATA